MTADKELRERVAALVMVGLKGWDRTLADQLYNWIAYNSKTDLLELTIATPKSKKRGRPPKKHGFAPSNGKRKYTKRSAFWKK